MTFKNLDREYFGGSQIVLIKENAFETIAPLIESGVPVVVMFVVTADGRLRVSTADKPIMPGPGEGAVVLIRHPEGVQSFNGRDENVYSPALEGII